MDPQPLTLSLEPSDEGGYLLHIKADLPAEWGLLPPKLPGTLDPETRLRLLTLEANPQKAGPHALQVHLPTELIAPNKKRGCWWW